MAEENDKEQLQQSGNNCTVHALYAFKKQLKWVWLRRSKCWSGQNRIACYGHGCARMQYVYMPNMCSKVADIYAVCMQYVCSIVHACILHTSCACMWHLSIFTPHAQRERGKVIGRGVHIYIAIYIYVCGRKKI